MPFEIDIHTKKDLDIFAENGESKSIFSLFDFTTCKGGQAKLYEYLSNPMTDVDLINERKNAIIYFQEHLSEVTFDIDKDTLNFAEYYQKHREYSLRKPNKIWRPINNPLLNKFRSGENYYVVEKGVKSIIAILHKVNHFCDKIQKEKDKYPNLLRLNNKKVYEILSSQRIKSILDKKEIKSSDIAEYNYTFRHYHHKDIQFIFELIYEYDALVSVAKTANEYNYTYAEVVAQNETCLIAEGLFHPFVNNAISNDIEFGRDSNLLFITGPNMAGKSTFLKALGISVYLAHVGFPVPARKFKISLVSGLCTTINISDNIQSGHSHFYAEVLRVKQVAKQLKKNRNMMVIFDELFRGTNVKDAYDGTLAIASAFAQIRSSFFVISTHIVEVADELGINKNINFRYFDIKEENGHPMYTYKLKDGISSDRLGMYIIRKEGVIELINEILEDDNTKDTLLK